MAAGEGRGSTGSHGGPGNQLWFFGSNAWLLALQAVVQLIISGLAVFFILMSSAVDGGVRGFIWFLVLPLVAVLQAVASLRYLARPIRVSQRSVHVPTLLSTRCIPTRSISDVGLVWTRRGHSGGWQLCFWTVDGGRISAGPKFRFTSRQPETTRQEQLRSCHQLAGAPRPPGCRGTDAALALYERICQAQRRAAARSASCGFRRKTSGTEKVRAGRLAG